MKFVVKILSLLLAGITCLSLFGCNNQGSVIELFYFNTTIHIETHDKPIKSKVLTQIKTSLSSLENTFDLESENGLISTFNSAEAGFKFENLTNDEVNVLSTSNLSFTLTDGLFNPTVYPLVKLWGFAPYKFSSNFIPPSAEQINEVLPLCDFSALSFDEENKTLTKLTGDVKLDFGGLVKGYASDKVADILLDAGHKSGYVNIGGSSLTLLSVQSLGIRHPDKKGQSILEVDVLGKENISVSTSGDYERFHLDKEKNKYSHLINPKNGYPTKTGVRSATVIGASGAVADALTTALCLCEYKTELPALLERITARYTGCMVFIVYDKDEQKEILTNKKQGENFTLKDTNYKVVNF